MTLVQTKLEFQKATNLTTLWSGKRSSDVTILCVDDLLDAFHLAADDDARVITLARLYYATDAWLKKAKRGVSDVNSRRTPGVYACFASVSYRLSELVEVPINLLPHWLTETFGKAMGQHGANLDITHELADYLSSAQVAKYRININGGLAYQQRWWLNSKKWVLANSSSVRDGTAEVLHKNGGANSEVLTKKEYSGYVMSQGGDLYSGPHFTPREKQSARYHSSYFGGEPILCAGEVLIKEGVIYEINNSSGHYRPGANNVSLMLEMFMIQGVRLKDLKISAIGLPAPQDAIQWMQANPTFQVAPAIHVPAGRRDSAATIIKRARDVGRGDTHMARARMIQTETNFVRQQSREKAFKLFDLHWKPTSNGGHGAFGKDKCADCKKYNEFYDDYLKKRLKL